MAGDMRPLHIGTFRGGKSHRPQAGSGSRAAVAVVTSKSNPKALYEHTPWSGFAGPSRVPRYSAAATCFADLAFASAFASAWALALATAALAASLCSNISRCSSSASTTGLIARSM